MTRQQVARTTQSSLSETPLVSGILPRAAVRPIPETAMQPQEDIDNSIWRESRFHHDFSQVSVHSAATPLIQPKLTIGSVGDKYEQEADRVARQVVSQINAPGNQTVQREEMPEKDDEEKLKSKLMVQRQSDSRSSYEDGIAATPELEASIQQARGSGQPLSDNIRKPMEQAFGFDFSRVKVHTDAQSERLNRSIQAKAFTTGQDMFFRQGAYSPGSRGGQELIAHELTHVVQQNGKAMQRLLRFPEPHVQKAAQIIDTISHVPLKAVIQCAKRNRSSDNAVMPAKKRRGVGSRVSGAAAKGSGPADAIPITWYKVDGIYVNINLIRPSDGQNLTCAPDTAEWVDVPPTINQGDLGTAPTRTVGAQLQVQIGGVTLPNGYVGSSRQRVENPARVRESIFKQVLIHNKFNWTGYAPDHILDLSLSGADEFSNLWPLDSATNLRANQTWNQRVRVGYGTATPTTHHISMMLSRLPNNKYVQIAALQNP